MPSVILRPAQPWGNVVQLGNKTYSLILTRRRTAGRLTFSPLTTAWLANVEAADLAEGEPPLEDAVYNAMGGYANYRIPLGGYCLFPLGAKTLNGALVPMLGPAPLGVNLVEGDYSRTLGIKGNAVNKRINLNYNNGTYGSLNDRLAGVWVSERDTMPSNNRTFVGAVPTTGRFFLRTGSGPGVGEAMQYAINGNNTPNFNNYADGSLLVAGRQNASDQLIYNNGTTQTNASASQVPDPFAMHLLCNANLTALTHTNARIAMFTDSAYIDPAVMDANMTAAVNAIAAALA